MGKTQKNLLLQNICNRRFFDTYGCIEENIRGIRRIETGTYSHLKVKPDPLSGASWESPGRGISNSLP